MPRAGAFLPGIFEALKYSDKYSKWILFIYFFIIIIISAHDALVT